MQAWGTAESLSRPIVKGVDMFTKLLTQACRAAKLHGGVGELVPENKIMRRIL